MAGLTATSFLAKAGVDVMLFEKIFYFGGLVNSFKRGEFIFDGGLRSIENSGIVFPMLKQLGIEIEFVKSQVSLVVGDSVLRLSGNENIDEYQEFLLKEFPNEADSIDRIIREIKKITKYMDVLYGIDNPLFMDLKKDYQYLLKVLLPWLFKFLMTVRRIEKLNEPIYPYLGRLTKNKELIDNIAQHFFKDTPTSFALSYFSLYNDYHYPIGATEMLPKKLEEFAKDKGAKMQLKTGIIKVDPEKKRIWDQNDEVYEYENLIWACDLKTLYRIIDTDTLQDKNLVAKILNRRAELKDLEGAESVFTTYLSIDKEAEYFAKIATEHCFYTPSKKGLSVVNRKGNSKEEIKEYLKDFLEYNTFEISIPCLRDSSLAPEGKTGLEVSILFDYKLTKTIVEQGWKKEFKAYMEEMIIGHMIRLYPDIKGKILKQFSSTPLTVERYTGNTEGAIVGWSFANPRIPVVHKFRDVAKSIKTPLRGIYKAGQWSYSPAGVPIAILTGKMAADKIIKKNKK